MLDLDHPMTKHIFAAARAHDAVLFAAKKMTIAGQQDRLSLKDSCQAPLAQLRQLAKEHFSDRPSILLAIDEFERAVAELASLPCVPAYEALAHEDCPACGSALLRRNEYGYPPTPWGVRRVFQLLLRGPKGKPEIYCSGCLNMIMPALAALSSCRGGFGTEAI